MNETVCTNGRKVNIAVVGTVGLMQSLPMFPAIFADCLNQLNFILMAKDFSNRSQTVGNYPIKDIKFNQTMGVWIGYIYDETWASKWITCIWDRRGKVKNKHADKRYNLE